MHPVNLEGIPVVVFFFVYKYNGTIDNIDGDIASNITVISRGGRNVSSIINIIDRVAK